MISLPNDFNIEFYRSFYKDLQHMNNDELVNHYLQYGINEKRIYKKKDNTQENTLIDINIYLQIELNKYNDLKFLSENELVNYCIKFNKLNDNVPTDFDIQFYKNYYHDLTNMTYIEAVNHYINYGKNEQRIYKENSDKIKTRYLSLGGWCGTAWSLRHNSLNDCDRALPFDFIRSKFEGIIDCFENNFSNFFPKRFEIDVFDNYLYSGLSIRGKYFGFFHHNLLDNNTIEGFNRRIQRLDEYLINENEKIIFIRTIIDKNYENEINLGHKFSEVIEKKYVNLKYILIFVIPEQPYTKYYKNISNKIFIMTVNDITHEWNLIKDKYKVILDFIKENDLFNNIPEPNNDIEINEIIGLEKEDCIYSFRDDN